MTNSNDELLRLRKQHAASRPAQPKAINSLISTASDAPLPPQETRRCRCGQPVAATFESVYARYPKADGTRSGNWRYAATCEDPECVAGDYDAKWTQRQLDDYGTTNYETRKKLWYARTLARFQCPPHLSHHRIEDFKGQDIAKTPENVLIVGPNGTGKSALSVALLSHWLPGEALWLSTFRILLRIKSTFGKQADESELEVIDYFTSVPVLVIDDLGAEHKTDFGIATLCEIVNERIQNGLATVITTNLSFAEIDKVEPRLSSRLAAFKLIKLAGRDRRVPQ